jgi:Transcriptional regulator, AbiEi antitoxin
MSHLETTAERAIAWIASRNHGVATRAQLLAAGLTADQITHRVRRGLLIRVYPGVYRVGHTAWSLESSYLAAVRACGDDAVLSGLAAAHFLWLVRGKPPAPEVTVPVKRRAKGVTVRRVELRPNERSRLRGIPVTSVARTLVDLAAQLDLDDLSLAFDEAWHRYRIGPGHVDRILIGRRGPPGAEKLRLVMGHDAELVLSRLERAFIALLRAHGLPLPLTNIRVGAHRIDCHWPDLNLILELDSFAFHNSRTSWESDRSRERAARATETEHQRLTWYDVVEEPGPTVEWLRRRLGQPARQTV